MVAGDGGRKIRHPKSKLTKEIVNNVNKNYEVRPACGVYDRNM